MSIKSRQTHTPSDMISSQSTLVSLCMNSIRQFVVGRIIQIATEIKEKVRCIFDLIKTINTNTPEYKYAIESIELRGDTTTERSAFIQYRTVGCRVVRRASVQDLNTSDVFASFKPEDAQKIVSIATVEALLNKDPESIRNKFVGYVEFCASKYGYKG